MRGKAELRIEFMQESRITPAYAGKRLDIEIIRKNEKDHPRLCGEKNSVRPKKFLP